jgi:outer membrane protein assembly factor BamD
MRAFHVFAGAALLCSFALVGCSGAGDKNLDVPEEENVPVETLYNQAADAMAAGRNVEAARLFEEVERQYPYSQWATKAEMMAAYSYYKEMRYDEAVIALDRFIELHPGNEDVDYALYLRALSFYEQISDVARDQALTQEALHALETLIRRFPESRYSRDATYKRDLALDHLAGKEMEIGRYYLNRGQLNAAVNRFKTVVKDYQTTTHVPEALHRLVEINTTLGLRSEATKVAAVLGYNYPGSKWYEKSYAVLDDRQRQELLNDRGFVDRAVDVLFKPD